MKSKLEILKKYLPIQQPKKHHAVNNIRMFGEEQEQQIQSDSDSEPKERIDSQSEDHQQKKKSRKLTKDQKMKRKFRQALGVDRGEQIDQFLDQLVIENDEGIDLTDLRKKKIKLTMENMDQQIKQQYGETNIKLQNFLHPKQQEAGEEQQQQEQDSQSDIEVDRNKINQPKTIYRNKDGTIREFSEQTEKQLHKTKVMSTLGEWEKGMKQRQEKSQVKNQTFGNTDISDEYKLQLAQRELFDDPMRVLKTKMEQQGGKIQLFKCKYPGPGNRYNIPPGHRWDGVVRGNNFQFKYLQNKNDIREKHDEQMRQYLRQL